MLLCSGPLTNTIQSWVKPSTVGFFLTWARCPSSSFTWTAHCGVRGAERPVSARGSGAGGTTEGQPAPSQAEGGRGAHRQNSSTYAAREKKIERHHRNPATKKNGPTGEGVQELSLPPGGRGEVRPLARGAVLQERAAGGRCQGRAVPLPGASAPGAPGAAAGTWLRRHPPPPSGCVRAQCRERREARKAARKEKFPVTPTPSRRRARGSAGRGAGGGPAVLTELAMPGAPVPLGRSLLSPAPTPQR